MSKTIKREIALVDDSGILWVMASLSATRVKAIMKEYAKYGINLQERVSA